MSKRVKILEEQEKKYWSSLLAGEESGLFELYQLYYRYLFDYGLHITKDTDTVKDCIQNFFLYIWERRAQLSQANNVRHYIVSSFKRNLLEVLQKEKSKFSFEAEIINDYNEDSIENHLIKNQEKQYQALRLSKAIESLPEKQRELIYLKYYQGYSYEEMAKMTNITVRTAYNQVHRAIQSLRKSKHLKPEEKLIIVTLLTQCLYQYIAYN